DAGLRGSIKIQTTCVFARSHPQRVNLPAIQLTACLVGNPQLESSVRRVEVAVDRPVARGDVFKSARPRVRCLQSKGTDGQNEETGRGDQADGKRAASWVPRGIEPRERG